MLQKEGILQLHLRNHDTTYRVREGVFYIDNGLFGFVVKLLVCFLPLVSFTEGSDAICIQIITAHSQQNYAKIAFKIEGRGGTLTSGTLSFDLLPPSHTLSPKHGWEIVRDATAGLNRSPKVKRRRNRG